MTELPALLPELARVVGRAASVDQAPVRGQPDRLPRRPQPDGDFGAVGHPVDVRVELVFRYRFRPEPRFEYVRQWAMSVPEIVNITVQTPYPGTETWLTESRRLTTLDYRLFDVQHAVLPTRLPLHRFYEELVKTQAVLARKHLGTAALAKTAGIVARQVMHGQTNFARMIWKFSKVYNPDRQYADHQQEVRYRLPEPAPQPTVIASQQDLFVHIPSQERRRARDQARDQGAAEADRLSSDG